MPRRNWTRDELLLTVNLYCKTPFGKMYKNNPTVISLAKIIDRTPSSVAWKLVNFASFDPTLKARGIKGASNASKLDREIWEEFNEDWTRLPYESELLLEQKSKKKNIKLPENLFLRNTEKITNSRVRLNQAFFRSTLLASYENKCCITGLNKPEFLIAGHIVPWSMDKKNRLNPCNGILLNNLHDKAFELGFITITGDYKLLVSSSLLRSKNVVEKELFVKYHNKKIILPKRFLPKKEFLEIHYETRFQK